VRSPNGTTPAMSPALPTPSTVPLVASSTRKSEESGTLVEKSLDGPELVRPSKPSRIITTHGLSRPFAVFCFMYSSLTVQVTRILPPTTYHSWAMSRFTTSLSRTHAWLKEDVIWSRRVNYQHMRKRQDEENNCALPLPFCTVPATPTNLVM
jgi:hypothetical protein